MQHNMILYLHICVQTEFSQMVLLLSESPFQNGSNSGFRYAGQKDLFRYHFGDHNIGFLSKT